ncbi:MAG TPA: decaprenyl-phosphate phosphoribosyltransferase [Blastocatellia bacterium]|nr:decaprenyl-phosphate phosphoribosyltransferase [Blastocatellia bacterium]
METGNTDSPLPEARVGAGSQVAALFGAMRPRQWVKNLFVVAPAIFAGTLFDRPSIFRVGVAFVVFCLVSSSVYLVNDVLDREADRLHPSKCNRAIASGRLSVGIALAVAVIVGLAGLALGEILGPRFLMVVAIYIVITLAYSLYFKHAVILDVMLLAAGFVLRVEAGAVAVSVPASEWLLLCTLLLALFLGFSKRRHELTLLEDGAANHRRVLVHYSAELLDQMIVIVATSAILCYILYTVWPSTVEKFHTNHLIFTVPFVIYCIFRYFYLIHQRQSGGDPTDTLLTDRPLLAGIVLWAVTAVAVVYSGR